jgi:hypothetical protein
VSWKWAPEIPFEISPFRLGIKEGFNPHLLQLGDEELVASGITEVVRTTV